LVDVESSVPDIARHLVQGRAQAYSRVFIEYQLFLQLALCDGLDSKNYGLSMLERIISIVFLQTLEGWAI